MIRNLRCLFRRLFFRIGADIFLIIIIPAAFLLVVLAYNLRENIRDVTLLRIEERLKNTADTALANMDFIEDNLSFVAKHLEQHFAGMGGEVKRITNEVPQPNWYKAAKYKNFMDDLETTLLMNNGFLQVCVINNSGREIIRFDRIRSGVKEIPFGELEDRSGRDYFKNAIANPAGSIYVHPITLDVEHGKILVPHTPVIRLCRKIVLSSGETFGILVLTVSPDVIFGLENRGEASGIVVIDEAGSYLRHRDPILLLAGEHGGTANLLNELPLLKNNLAKHDIMTIFDGKMGEYRVWRKVFYRHDDRAHFWVFVERHPEFSIISGYTDILVKNAMILVIVIFVGFSLVVAVIYRSLLPLKDITAAIRKLESGDMTARAPTDAKNEIGEIAGAFNSMAARLNQTALELQRSMALAKSISDIAPTAHIISNSAGRIISVNPAAEQMFGYSPGEMHEKSVKELTPSYKENEYLKYIQDYINFKKTGLPEKRNTVRTPKEVIAVKKSGEIFYNSLFVKEVPLADEDVFVGIMEDITERRAAQIALTEAAENSNAIMNASSETLALIGEQGNIIAINEAGANRFSAHRADLVGKSLFQILPLELALRRMEYFVQSARTGKPVKFEDERNGRFYESSIYPVIDRDARVTRFAIFAVDVTERKLADESLQRSMKNLKKAQQITHLGSWELDLATYRPLWSDETFRILGFEPGEVVPSFDIFMNCLHPDDRKTARENLDAVMNGGELLAMETRIVWKDGLERTAKVQGEVVRDDMGVPVRLVGTVHDITEFKNLEQMRDNFFHAVVHDLKSPITGIKLELDMLADQIAAFSAECSTKEPCRSTFNGFEPSFNQKIADIGEGIDQLHLMIQSLLKLGEIEEEKLELQYMPFAMNDLLGEVEHDFRGRAAAKGLAIEFRNTFTGTVIADFKLIKRVLQNLVDNAVKYSLPNTAITIDSSCARKGASCENIMVSITNTGEPLTGEKINTLFKKFKTHGHAESGSGIGLFFCHKTMDLLGGGIYVDQESSTITFHIYFPNG